MDIIDAFTKVGFTRQEATVYITLCREGELTGYEAAKLSGISRSNSYLALAGLVDKGAAWRIEGEVVKYTAVSFEELEINIIRQTKDVLSNIKENVPTKEEPKEAFITIKGENNISNKMKNIIDKAKFRVYISMSYEDMKIIDAEICRARDRGLKVVLITSKDCKVEGVKIYTNEKPKGQIRIIADSSEVITGEIDGSENCTSLYSKNPNLVQLLKDALTNEIKLIEIDNNL